MQVTGVVLKIKREPHVVAPFFYGQLFFIAFPGGVLLFAFVALGLVVCRVGAIGSLVGVRLV